MSLEKCEICEGRKDLKKRLDRKVKEIKDKTKRKEAREGIRLPSFEFPHMNMSSSGYVGELYECCGGIVGSISDYFLPDNKRASHHHVCAKCGKRFPEEGSYRGDYVNDDLQ